MIIDDTIEFIKIAHEGATHSNKPYYLHPVAVSEIAKSLYREISSQVSCMPISEENVILGCLLHDVIEDTKFTKDYLREKGYSNDVLNIVTGVTRDAKLTYLNWIQKIADSGEIGTIITKMADNLHNSDPRNISLLPPEKQSIVNRYEKSKKILRKAIEKFIKQFRSV